MNTLTDLLVPKEQRKTVGDIEEDLWFKCDGISDLYMSDYKDTYLHYFTEGCDWYIYEWDFEDMFYGYVKLNNGYSNYSYINRKDLINIDNILLSKGLPALQLEV